MKDIKLHEIKISLMGFSIGLGIGTSLFLIYSYYTEKIFIGASLSLHMLLFLLAITPLMCYLNYYFVSGCLRQTK